jgi:hypothetical protein
MKSHFNYPRHQVSNRLWLPVVSAFIFLGLFSPWLAEAQPQNVPDPAAMGRALVEGIAGNYSAPPKLLVTDKVTGAPVTGNGDLAITVGGAASALKFYVGKTDFWGVLRGAIMPVGSLTLNVPALKGGTYSLNENVGPATVTGTFKKDGYGLSVMSWVATAENTAVIQLKNVGKQPLTLSSQLLDGFAGSAGNPATYGSTKNSTWLNVSPDTVYFELGSQKHNVLAASAPSFNGRIADVRLFDEALSGEALATPDYVDALAPKPLLIWTATNPGTATLVGDAGDVTLNKSDLHGGSVVLKGHPGAEVLVGDLPLPQNQFTVSAWINLSTPGSNGCIVAAQIPYPQTYSARYPYPYVRGLTLQLVKGALSASLNQSGTYSVTNEVFNADAVNQFAATAKNPLPAGQWIRAAVTYDGSVLKIYTNGIEVGATAPFPTGTNGMMGWNKMAMHIGDTNVPYNACGPQGLLIQRVLGAKTTETNQGELTFTIPAGGQATLVLAAVTDRNHPDYFFAAQKQARGATTAALARLRKQHDQWWSDFWSKSFVQIPDQKIQDSWYASLYLLACCSTSNAPAPGLWGNFNTSPSPAWSGDYTLDYNYEATFWGALACNHAELADNYDRPLLEQMSRGRSTAEYFCRTNHGIYYYCHLIPTPGWSDDPGTFWGQKANAIFAAVNCAMRWKYTQDPAYAAKIYPYLKGVADFWDDYLVLQDGHYVDYHDSCWENSGDDQNPVTTLAFIQLVYPALVDISKLLNVDEDRRAKWNDIIARLAPLPIVPASSIPALKDLGTPYNAPGVSVIRNSTKGAAFPTPMVKSFMDHTIRMSGAGMSSAQVIFPGWNIGLESEPSLLLAASNTLWLAAQWYDYNNECNFYPGAACAGYDPNTLLSTLDTFLTHYRYNNFMIDVGGGGTEHYAIVPATLAAMFVQSYQTNLHVFPDWPKDQSAAFGQLNACGGFLVSSAITLGRPEYVRIESAAGKMLNLANPWPGEKIRCVSSRSGTADWSGVVLHYQTEAGEILTFTPPLVKPLSAPGHLRTDQLGRVVYLDWDGVPDAAGYNVKRATSRGGPYLNVATVMTGSRFTDTNAAYGTSYFYAVSALAPGQESARSADVRVTLPPPPPVPKPTIFKQHLNIGTANEGDYVESAPQAATMTGDSGDIWEASDSFEFAWQELDGDGSIACRVASIENGMEWAKAGVMIRETTNSVARNAALLLTPGHGATFQYRAVTNGISDYHPTGDLHIPGWLKLARQGNNFYATVSTNGVTWTPAAGSPQVIQMGSKVCIGLAVSAHAGPAATAEFDHLTVTGTKH